MFCKHWLRKLLCLQGYAYREVKTSRISSRLVLFLISDGDHCNVLRLGFPKEHRSGRRDGAPRGPLGGLLVILAMELEQICVN